MYMIRCCSGIKNRGQEELEMKTGQRGKPLSMFIYIQIGWMGSWVAKLESQISLISMYQPINQIIH
jgi:hypothetical protein